jgi:predicted nucleotidyltransferase
LFEFIELKEYLERLPGCRVDLGTPESLTAQPHKEVLQAAVYVA